MITNKHVKQSFFSTAGIFLADSINYTSQLIRTRARQETSAVLQSMLCVCNTFPSNAHPCKSCDSSSTRSTSVRRRQSSIRTAAVADSSADRRRCSGDAAPATPARRRSSELVGSAAVRVEHCCGRTVRRGLRRCRHRQEKTSETPPPQRRLHRRRPSWRPQCRPMRHRCYWSPSMADSRRTSPAAAETRPVPSRGRRRRQEAATSG